MANHSIPTSGPQGQHALYRFYGDTGQLLYVGITHDPGKRLAQHMTTKHWWTSVRGIALEWYTNREDAAAAERRAIRVERPLMNLQRPAPVAPPARRCGHCPGCRDSEPCYIYENQNADPFCDPCPKCGQPDCLYAVGYSIGEQDGWTAAWNWERRRRG